MGKIIAYGVDCGGSASDANKINYNDTNTSLGAENVQTAIEAVDTKVNDLNSNLTGLIPITETGSTTSRAYNFGEVIRYGNNLYVAAQNIAQGTNINDAIIIGYFVETNVVSKINGLNNNKQNLLLGENEGFQDLKNWVIYHTGENYPVRVMPYGGLGWSDCPLGATYGTIISFGNDVGHGYLVVCVPNSKNILYWNIINNSGNWINIEWNTIS